MNQKPRSLIIMLLLLMIFLTTNTIIIPTEEVYASEDKISILINKISNDYSKKFCNSIGFGLSKESAMKFSYSENKSIFKNRKGIENIDKDLLANKIATSVIDSCGYNINLYGDKDIKDFANYYLSFDKDYT